MDAGTEIGGCRILRVMEDGVVTTALAERVDGGDRVRLRVLDPATAALPANRERFRSDTRLALAVADCPSIVPVLDVGETDGGGLFVVERASDDETLASLLDRTGPLVAAEAIALVTGIGAALDALAAAEVAAHVLRLRPATIRRRTTDGAWLLTDLVIDLTTVVGGGPPIGFDYAAPEVRDDQADDVRVAHLYALTLILVEALTGRPPTPGPARVPGLPERLGPVVERALAEAPADRYPTGAALAEAVRAALVDRPVDDDVQFTVYRPRAVQPERAYRLLAFVHKTDHTPDEPDPVEEVEHRAEAALGREKPQYRTRSQDATSSFHHGEEIVLVPEMDGVSFYPRVRSFRWRRAVHQEEFDLEVHPGHVGTIVTGRLTVFLSSVPIAEVPLKFPVVADASAPQGPPDQVESARPYRRIFPSYSHKDREIVDQVGYYVTSMGDEFMRDVSHLRSGQVWSEEIRSMIRESDVFALYWSWNSMVSPHVRAEWEYALSLDRPDFVRPVYWNDPRPEAPEQDLPPPALDRLHFTRVPLVTPQPPPVPTVAPTAMAPAGAAPSPDQTTMAAPAMTAAAEPPPIVPTAVADAPAPPPSGPGLPAPPAPPAPAKASRGRIGLLAAVPAGAIAIALAITALSGGGGGGQVAGPAPTTEESADASDDVSDDMEPGEEFRGSIAPGERATGFIVSGGADVYALRGTGRRLVIRVIGSYPTGGLDPTVRVRDDDGDEVGFDDDGGGSATRDARLVVTLDEGATYAVVVEGFGGTKGDYELTVT